MRRTSAYSWKFLHPLMNVFFFPAFVESLQIIDKSSPEPSFAAIQTLFVLKVVKVKHLNINRSNVWRVIRVKIQCTNFFQFEFRNKSFCVQLLSNCSSLSSLNFETSLFAYNYFLIAALTACLIVNEVYLGITC